MYRIYFIPLNLQFYRKRNDIFCSSGEWRGQVCSVAARRFKPVPIYSGLFIAMGLKLNLALKLLLKRQIPEQGFYVFDLNDLTLDFIELKN